MRQSFGALAFLIGATVIAFSALWTPASAQSEAEALTVEYLLKSGWQVAGDAAAAGNRTAMVLFKNPSETYLDQCLTGYDVTRTPLSRYADLLRPAVGLSLPTCFAEEAFGNEDHGHTGVDMLEGRNSKRILGSLMAA